MTETLVDKIYEFIQEDIITNQLLPGQRLHIAQLAEHHQVGPGPIREALSRLLATELVVAISQRGFRVAPISRENLNDIYKTRILIEELALQLSIEHGDDKWEADVVGAHYHLAKFESEHQLTSPGDYKEWEQRHRAFNRALLSACGLQHLLSIQQQLYLLTERYRRQWLIAGIKCEGGLPYAKAQRKIMAAALGRNTELALKLLRLHYEEAVKVIESYFINNDLFDSQVL